MPVKRGLRGSRRSVALGTQSILQRMTAALEKNMLELSKGRREPPGYLASAGEMQRGFSLYAHAAFAENLREGG